jgi:hypothetical protein
MQTRDTASNAAEVPLSSLYPVCIFKGERILALDAHVFNVATE